MAAEDEEEEDANSGRTLLFVRLLRLASSPDPGRFGGAIGLPVKRFRSVDDKGVDDTKERAEPRNGGLVRT